MHTSRLFRPQAVARTSFGSAGYGFAIVVDALGAGLLRPFLLLYGLTLDHVALPMGGLAVTGGLLLGLALLPVVGRWIDRGPRRGPVAATLCVRLAALVVLVSWPGPPGFAAAALLLGVGTQLWPVAHAAMVSSLVGPVRAEEALAVTRSMRNAGLGVGAGIAGIAVAQGVAVLHLLAWLTAAGFAVAAVTVATLAVPSGPPAARTDAAEGQGLPSRFSVLLAANLPFALCFDVLEVALPVLLVTRLHVSPTWPAAMFVGNTVMVIGLQLLVVRALARRNKRSSMALGGIVLASSYLGFAAAGAVARGNVAAATIAGFTLVYTMGELIYAGVGTALVIAESSPALVGRALARWQVSTGLGRALAPALMGWLLGVDVGLLWSVLAVATVGGSALIASRPRPVGSLRQPDRRRRERASFP